MRKNRDLSFKIFCVLFLLWVFGIILAYYIFHKPITTSQFEKIGLAIIQCLMSALIISTAGGVGSQFVKGERGSPLIRFAIQAALGLGILSLGTLLIGTCFSVSKWFFGGVTVALAIALWKSILEWWKQVVILCKEFNEFGVFDKVLFSLIIFIFLITLINSLAPPTKFDTLVYHLTLPKSYLQEGKISYTPWLIFWGMPQMVEMLSTWGMALGGPEAAVVLGWMIGAVAVIGLYGLVSRYFGQRAGLVSIAALLSGFTTAQSLSWGYAGWMNILLGTAFLTSFIGWFIGTQKDDLFSLILINAERRGYLISAGVFAGLAFGVKYSSGILLIIGLGLILVKSKPVKKKIVDILIYLGIALLVFSPWLIKNFVATGNPLYPFFTPSGAMDQIRLDYYQNPPSSRAWWDILLLPVKSTILGKEGGPGYGASIGPLLISLGLIGGFHRKGEPIERASVKKISLGMALIGTLIWGLGGWYSGYLVQTRLYYPLFPALTLLAGSGYDYLRQCQFRNVNFHRVISGLVVFVVVLSSFQLLAYNLDRGAILNVFSIKSDERYLDGNLGWHAPAMREIRDLPTGAHVLMLWEPRGFYCIPTCDPDEILDRWTHDVRIHSTREKIIAHWLESGYTHILYNSQGAQFLRETDSRYDQETWRELDRLWDVFPDPLEIGGGYKLYELGE